MTKESFINCNVRLKNVQNDLLKIFNKNTILIGHSLESDFKALKVSFLKIQLKYFTLDSGEQLYLVQLIRADYYSTTKLIQL